VVSLLANIILAALLMWPLKHVGLALATSLASMLNLILLTLTLRRRLGRISGSIIGRSVIKDLAAGTVMGAVVLIIRLLSEGGADSTLELGLMVLGGVALGGGVYIGVSALLRNTELAYIWNFIRRRKSPA